ncbi:MAG: rRNA maturation RNase YbeY [Phycisphaerae bacterium]
MIPNDTMRKKRSNTKLNIQITYCVKKKDISSQAVKKLVNTICEKFGLSEANIGIVVIADSQIKKLNAKFLGHNKITDCLSFDLSGDSCVKSFEIIINNALAAREALRRGHCVKAELALYITHGLLHQLGFDDQKPGDAKKMHKAEDEILQKLGYNSVYQR